MKGRWPYKTQKVKKALERTIFGVSELLTNLDVVTARLCSILSRMFRVVLFSEMITFSKQFQLAIGRKAGSEKYGNQPNGHNKWLHFIAEENGHKEVV